MRPRADFKCEDCGEVRELPLPPEGEYHTCPICDGYFERIWTAPHMGQMSSGEPPR